MSMWDRVRRYAGPFIEQDHRVCGVCERRFLSGVVRIERGYTVGAICHTCLGKVPVKDLGDLVV